MLSSSASARARRSWGAACAHSGGLAMGDDHITEAPCLRLVPAFLVRPDACRRAFGEGLPLLPTHLPSAVTRSVTPTTAPPAAPARRTAPRSAPDPRRDSPRASAGARRPCAPRPAASGTRPKPRHDLRYLITGCAFPGMPKLLAMAMAYVQRGRRKR